MQKNPKKNPNKPSHLNPSPYPLELPCPPRKLPPTFPNPPPALPHFSLRVALPPTALTATKAQKHNR